MEYTKFFAFGFLMATLSIFSPHARAQSDEIVVTGTRISSFESDIIPYIHLKRKPDFIIQEIFIESDSRSRTIRLDEINKTMLALIAEAKKNPQIELSLKKSFEIDGDEVEYLVPFSKDNIEIQSGRRQDTNRIYLVAKTPIKSSDTDLEKVEQRLEKFLSSIKKTGRSTIIEYSTGITLVDIQQYRDEILTKITADNDRLISILGEGYTIEIIGLEHPIRWRVTGPLELSLYFPYKSAAKIN